MKTEDLPFPLGQTYSQGVGTPAATDGADLEGKEYWVESIAPANAGETVKQYLTGRPKKVRIVRNESGGTLAGKLLAKMKTDGSAKEFMSQVMGLAGTVGEHCYPIDEFLVSTVPNHDLFYIVIEGPAKVTTAGAGDTNIAVGNYVIPSTSGTVIDQDTTVAAGSATFNQIQGAVGRCVTAVNGTATDFYIEVTKK